MMYMDIIRKYIDVLHMLTCRQMISVAGFGLKCIIKFPLKYHKQLMYINHLFWLVRDVAYFIMHFTNIWVNWDKI
jgi:hypothetical protein